MPNWKKVLTSGSDASLNTLTVTNGITGSLLGTASYASQALSASFATTASYVTLAQTASYVTLAQTSSFTTTAQTASFVILAQTASFITTAQTASRVTSSGVFGPNGANSILTSSFATTASFVTLAQTASFVTLAQTASFVTLAQTASFVTTSQTASFVTLAQTASLALRASGSLTGSLLGTAATASFVTTAQTASFVTLAQTASFVTTAQTASYVLQAVSASFATTSTTQTAGNSTTAVATTAFVTTADNLKANLATPTFTTNITTPLVIGGTAVGSTLTYKTTTGIGTTDAHIFQVGDNGATEAMRITNSGNVGIGTTPTTGYSLHVGKNLTGSASPVGIYNAGQIQSDATTDAAYFQVRASTAAGAYVIPNLYHYYFSTSALGAGSSITNQYGYFASAVTQATNNYGFYGNLSANATRWNIYMNGTAQNYFAGNVGIGNSTPTAILHLKAGSATANTSPLKFTSGATMSIAEAGSVEFLTDAYYGTITTGAARKTFAFLESPTFTTPALGTPSALVGTNITGTATNFTASTVTTNANLTGHITSVGNATVLGSFTTAQLLAAVTGETGTGAVVFGTSPILTTPTIGVATATSVNKVTITAPATSATLTLVNGGSLITAGAFSTTLTSTAATNVTLPTTGTLSTLAGTETLTNKTLATGTIAVTQASNTNNTTIATTAYADANQIFTASLSITSAQIKSLFSSPLTIVSAPAAGKYIDVISAVAEMTYITAPYATNTTLMLIMDTSTNEIMTNSAVLTATTDIFYKFTPVTFGSQTTAHQIQTVKALQVKVQTGNPIAGAGTLKVKVLYRIVTV